MDPINNRGLAVELCGMIGGADGDGRGLGEVGEPMAALVPTEAPEAEHVSGLRSAWCGGFDPTSADDLASEHLDPEAAIIAAEEGRLEAAIVAVRTDPMVSAWRSYPQAVAEAHRAA